MVEGSVRLKLVRDVAVVSYAWEWIDNQILVIICLDWLLLFEVLNVAIDVRSILEGLVGLWVYHYFFLHFVCQILDNQKL